MPPFLTGLFFGFLFIFSLGPGFFTLIQTSVQKGFSKAILLALGISMSDICYVTLLILGISAELQRPEVKMWMAIIGSTVLLGYGVYSWFKPPVVYAADQDNSLNNRSWRYLVKGFFLNGFNPFIIFFWIAIASYVAVKYSYTLDQQIIFFVGVLVTILSMDIIKAYTAHRLRNLITAKIIQRLNRIVSVILIVFGLRIVYFLIENYLLPNL